MLGHDCLAEQPLCDMTLAELIARYPKIDWQAIFATFEFDGENVMTTFEGTKVVTEFTSVDKNSLFLGSKIDTAFQAELIDTTFSGIKRGQEFTGVEVGITFIGEKI